MTLNYFSHTSEKNKMADTHYLKQNLHHYILTKHVANKMAAFALFEKHVAHKMADFALFEQRVQTKWLTFHYYFNNVWQQKMADIVLF
jgi:hypothetical protein